MKATAAAIALTALIGVSSAKPVEMPNKDMADNVMRVAERRGFLSMFTGDGDDEDEEAEDLPVYLTDEPIPTETVDIDCDEPAPTQSIEASVAQVDDIVGPATDIGPVLENIMNAAKELKDRRDAAADPMDLVGLLGVAPGQRPNIQTRDIIKEAMEATNYFAESAMPVRERSPDPSDLLGLLGLPRGQRPNIQTRALDLGLVSQLLGTVFDLVKAILPGDAGGILGELTSLGDLAGLLGALDGLGPLDDLLANLDLDSLTGNLPVRRDLDLSNIDPSAVLQLLESVGSGKAASGLDLEIVEELVGTILGLAGSILDGILGGIVPGGLIDKLPIPTDFPVSE
ncbi:hypothetical protein ACRALDRAFT_1060904 [Sodiomyces alcalophilus JCM 7366]|uniref:uncharacterized protein n=1 Tax=Sodiomyces alcalophilus JCM 7366 TaxID=591952 RepID=UPI0039B3C193